ncbi:hypothetical protein VNI00_011214 [Paramarasmius palmivorus]|uniref:Uncharacterized protein n=1 Tax=Paramarasmius palmivorus TaxID=297713 RepID=A0AAW0CD11_9AGAR
MAQMIVFRPPLVSYLYCFPLLLVLSRSATYTLHSEDEDAPSPLTRRLSGILSRKTSLASLGNGRPTSSASAPNRSKSYGNLRSSSSFSTRTPSRSSTKLSSSSSHHPLSRSYSSTTLLETEERSDSDDGYPADTFHGYSAVNRSMPPSSWQGQSIKSRKSGSTRTSTGSNSSLAISIPDSKTGIVTPTANGFGKSISRSVSEASLSSNRSIPLTPQRSDLTFPAPEEILKTPSSSSSMSSVSIPMPTTPKDDDDTPTPSASLMRIDQNKMLPPLPNPRTGSIRRPAAPGLAARFASPKTLPRSRSNSVGKPESPAIKTTDIPPMPTTAPLPPRQLQLPRYTAASGQLRTPTRSTPTTPVGTKPTPRTGTGMVYRSSSGGARTSMMRMPSSTMLRTSASEGRI